MKKVTPQTVANLLNKKAAAYAGFKLAYPDMPLIDEFLSVYEAIPGIETQVITEREGVSQYGDWSIWGHDYTQLICTIRSMREFDLPSSTTSLARLIWSLALSHGSYRILTHSTITSSWLVLLLHLVCLTLLYNAGA